MVNCNDGEFPMRSFIQDSHAGRCLETSDMVEGSRLVFAKEDGIPDNEQRLTEKSPGVSQKESEISRKL